MAERPRESNLTMSRSAYFPRRSSCNRGQRDLGRGSALNCLAFSAACPGTTIGEGGSRARDHWEGTGRREHKRSLATVRQ
jgi:hypothetical protein